MTKNKGKTPFVTNILSSTLNITGASKNEIITGVGINHEHHLGLQLKLFGKVKKNEKYINCDFQLLRSGNGKNDLEDYVISGKRVNVEMLKEFKEKYFKTEYFVNDSKLTECEIPFKIGEKREITKYNNKGLKIVISRIEKYPDDPEKESSTFGAYYSYIFDRKRRYKKECYLK